MILVDLLAAFFIISIALDDNTLVTGSIGLAGNRLSPQLPSLTKRARRFNLT
jgi:hypothetical protein